MYDLHIGATSKYLFSSGRTSCLGVLILNDLYSDKNDASCTLEGTSASIIYYLMNPSLVQRSTPAQTDTIQTPVLSCSNCVTIELRSTISLKIKSTLSWKVDVLCFWNDLYIPKLSCMCIYSCHAFRLCAQSAAWSIYFSSESEGHLHVMFVNQWVNCRYLKMNKDKALKEIEQFWDSYLWRPHCWGFSYHWSCLRHTSQPHGEAPDCM